MRQRSYGTTVPLARPTRHRWVGLTLAVSLAAGLCGPAPWAFGAPATLSCQAAKVKAAGRKVFDKAKCHQKALQKSLPLDSLCIQKAEEKFIRAIAKADTLGTCYGTAVVIEAIVDDCVATIVDELGHPKAPQCTNPGMGCGSCQVGGGLCLGFCPEDGNGACISNTGNIGCVSYHDCNDDEDCIQVRLGTDYCGGACVKPCY